MSSANYQKIADKMITLEMQSIKNLKSNPMIKGIGFGHFLILMLLNERGEMPMNQLSAFLQICKPNLTPIIDKLIDKDLVKRERNFQDRRIVNCSLTTKGKKLCSKYKNYWMQKFETMFPGISDEQTENILLLINNLSIMYGKI